jgi:predicted ATP-dependent endonuclease of OLD family
LFLFDEPAANLHARAQGELLQSLERIAIGNNRVIYSTHSPHMIDPKWLSGAYIVENKALDYEDVRSDAFDTQPTKIEVKTYRDFVSQHPDRTSYFQPVLERLQYVAPALIGEPPYLVVEGITDYFAFRLAIEGVKEKKRRPKINLLPAFGGANSMITILRSWGQAFAVLLDDDLAGRKEANRYRNEWFLLDTQVFTLGDLDAAYAGKRMEKLLSDDTLANISQRTAFAGTPNKKQIGLALSEALANSNSGILSNTTAATFLDILDKSIRRMSV